MRKLVAIAGVLACAPGQPPQTSEGATGEGSATDVTVTGTNGDPSGPGPTGPTNPSGSECGSNEDCGTCGACFEGYCVNPPGEACCETDLDCMPGQVCVPQFVKECTSVEKSPACDGAELLALSQIDTQGETTAMVLADLDGDGDLDVALARAAEVEVLLGDGTGTFVAGGVFPTGLAEGPQRLAAGDLDGDGEPDLAVLRDAPVGELAILFGQEAKYMAPVIDVFGIQPGALWLGDVDGDQDTDLLAHNAAGPSALSLRAGDGQGALAPEVGVYAGTLQAPAAAPLPDGALAVIHSTVLPNGVKLELLRFDAGSFASTTAVNTSGTTPFSAAGFALFEGSGEPDLFGLRDLQGATALQMWYGGVTHHEAAIGDGKAIGGVGDVDGDAFADLVTFTPGAPGVAVHLLDPGLGALCTWVHPLDGVFAPTHVAVGDIDSDGRADIVAAGATMKLALLRTAP